MTPYFALAAFTVRKNDNKTSMSSLRTAEGSEGKDKVLTKQSVSLKGKIAMKNTKDIIFPSLSLMLHNGGPFRPS
ncbi:MAG: hypothetical protein LBT18_02605 [Endomicrobium sp.]|nr:hypothetical protein [Endomicrobium sp.]